MPGNLYGCSQPGLTPTRQLNAGDIAAPAGTETNVIAAASTITAPGQGNWYVQVWYNVVVLCGATPPSGLFIGGRLAALADFDSVASATAILLANATLQLSGTLVSPAAQSNFFPTGAVVNVTVLATGQNVTIKQSGTNFVVGLFRGPDA